MTEPGFTGSEGRRAATLLEWASILESVSEQCALEAAATQMHRSRPTADRRALAANWAHFDELQRDG